MCLSCLSDSLAQIALCKMETGRTKLSKATIDPSHHVESTMQHYFR